MRFFIGMALLFFLGCATHHGLMSENEIYGPQSPVITQAFASKQLALGDTWKVYLNASDPEGDMEYIVCAISQPGVASYPATRTNIRERWQKDLSGYLYLTTGNERTLEFLTLRLTVQIQDKEGHYSKSVSLPFTFTPKPRREDPPSGIFKEQSLGAIMINLMDTGSSPMK